MRNTKKTLLHAENICIDIPVISKTDLSLKKTFVRSITGGRVAKNKRYPIVNALSNINLTINSGERIALIGHNGSGKSTFIRLISGIYEPTKGNFYCPNKAYPMLQRSLLVSDFLTGIDAAKAHYLLMNNNLKNFDNFIEDVKKFSGLGDFIALPLRTYSEGMTARLIFSLLTYHSHEFLALDEGLGTGDSAFYSKAEKRLEKFFKKTGTLVLASHSKELLSKFCTRGLVFSQGSIIYDGKLKDALNFYDTRN